MRSLCLLIAAALLGFQVGCVDREQDILGSWQAVRVGEQPTEGQQTQSLKINADKTYALTSPGRKVSGTWVWMGDRISLTPTKLNDMSFTDARRAWADQGRNPDDVDASAEPTYLTFDKESKVLHVLDASGSPTVLEFHRAV